MGKKSTPAPPDYTKLAEMTAQSSKDAIDAQTRANRANQTTPWGSNTWTQDAQGNWTNQVTLSPDQQAANDAQQRIQGYKSDIAETLLPRMNEEYGKEMDWSSLTPWADAPLKSTMGQVQGSDASRQRAEDAIYQSEAARLDPQWAQQEKQMAAKLANQGITQGSSAYQQAMDQLAQQKASAYSQAQLQSITGAGAEAQRNQGMDLARAQNQWNQGLQGATFQNQQRGQMLAEMMQKRGFSLNEINAILSGAQVSTPTFGGYNTAGASQATDYSGAGQAQYGAAMDAYNARQASSPLNAAASLAGTAMNAYTGGAGSMLGQLGPVSDRRVKCDIRRIGKHPRGYGVFEFRYIGERGKRVGVIAQDVQRVRPDLVLSHNGVLMVRHEALEGI
jgi:hypothetical protein